MASFPSPRHLVASLISSISSRASSTRPSAAVPTGNPLKDAPPATQKLLLTLHVLFPNELLPALDLLDRGLVTRFILSASDHAQPQQAAEANSTDRREAVVHYVRSAQQPSNRHRSAMLQLTTSYEVRLTSWSCSCPAFAFAAFPADASAPYSSTPLPCDGLEQRPTDWIFGGLTLGTDMPVCKHLLACVLVERCEIFMPFAEEREVSAEELAGWAAGWSD